MTPLPFIPGLYRTGAENTKSNHCGVVLGNGETCSLKYPKFSAMADISSDGLSHHK